MTALPDLLSEQDAARRLGLSVEQLRRLRYRRAISFRQLTGKKVAYTEADLAEYVEQTRCAPSTGQANTASNGAQIANDTSSHGGTRTGEATGAVALARQTFSPRNSR